MQATLPNWRSWWAARWWGRQDWRWRGGPAPDALPGHITMVDSAERARDLAGSRPQPWSARGRSFPKDPGVLVDDVHPAFSRS